ncbi:phospholipase D-like domain-containing protein [Pantoea sp. GM01]|uniref:phospholipase D-like domain-containing protein n=1 Tax=Pantoea sp. GM01 TaxID=1144320 RepID=UPI0002712C82|nr:phospholipase D-like domain-containing protein [Pantoea sp. GM01]EJL90843.1 phosphatidylserine/phosphatidylglycerophosphate/cardiolipin synthase [Pantoea sp. GM01]
MLRTEMDMLPVFPEGRLDDPTIVSQIHLTRQSLVFDSHSLLNRIRCSLWVKQQLEEKQVPRKEWHRRILELEKGCDDSYLNIDIEACYTSVTLLNLRDHGELNGQPVTEQIYVHSKLMIVDDRWVLVGSANINDRSLLGSGDSELAVTIADTAHSFNDLDGTGTPAPCRNFARELRQNAWRKWMGSAAAECEEALDKPAWRASWEKIQAIAKDNARIFDAVFNFIPRNKPKPKKGTGENYSDDISPSQEGGDVPASIWPVMTANQSNNLTDRENMPFSEIFWHSYNSNSFANRHRLNEIKGYFTALSTGWTSGEDNLIPYNMRLIAQRDFLGSDESKISMNEIVENEERLS